MSEAQRRRNKKQHAQASREKARNEDSLENPTSNDLETRVGIQASLKQELPTVSGIDLSTYYEKSSDGPRGDVVYAVHVPEKEKLYLISMHVAGGEVLQMQLMKRLKDTIDVLVQQDISFRDIVIQANQFAERYSIRGEYVVATMAELDLQTKDLSLANAGDHPSILYSEGEIMTYNPMGFALGFDPGPIFKNVLKIQKIQLRPGDRFVLYAKGVVTQNSENDFGEDRLGQVVGKAAGITTTAEDLNRQIMSAVNDHIRHLHRRYDYALLTMRVQ